jgi:hypothetical protein
MPSGVEALMGSRLQSNCTTHDAKVDTLMPLGFFHTFQTGLTLNQNGCCRVPLSKLQRRNWNSSRAFRLLCDASKVGMDPVRGFTPLARYCRFTVTAISKDTGLA